MSEPAPTPPRLTAALAAQGRLNAQNIWFAPIRHHSPACAFALRQLLAEVRPSHVLIEAPQGFNALLPDLLSADTVPPVAVFAQAQTRKKGADADDETGGADIRSAYFPFCGYSPEWVALREGAAAGAEIRFIDADWAAQCAAEAEHGGAAQDGLMSERYLAHSRYIRELARRLHCRDHDEVWEHLFELQSPERLRAPQRFFADVFAWCALARLDYEDEVLLREGSLHREYAMYRHICDLRQRQPESRILVVTGGFHTLALIEHLSGGAAPPPHLADTRAWQEDAWLIRYSFDRLDALSGYASGMPSPAYYQQFWQDLHTAADDEGSLKTAVYDYLSRLIRQLDADGLLQTTAYTALAAAAAQAEGLAALRGHYRAGRYDLLDALHSTLVKGSADDGAAALWQAVRTFMGGSELGKTAAGQRSPALLQNTYRQAQGYRFRLDDTLAKTRKLDVYRKPQHRLISRFLHLTAFVGSGFAERLSGPDFVGGSGLDLLFEEWRYAWTPAVEARLLELAEQGDSLRAIAAERLLTEQRHLEDTGQGASAGHTARLLAQACRLGLENHLARLQKLLDTLLQNDSRLDSLIDAARRLFYLWHGRKLLQLPEESFENSILLAIRHSIYRLNQIYDTRQEQSEANLPLLVGLHGLIAQAAERFPAAQDFADAFYRAIDPRRLAALHLTHLKGAADTLMFLDKRIGQSELQNRLAAAFTTGTPPETAVRYLQGVFHTAPEIFVQSAAATAALHRLIAEWDAERFLAVLPDLRQIFSSLNPKQSRQIADQAATLTGLAPAPAVFTDIGEADMLAAAALDTHLRRLLAADGMAGWLGL